MENLNEAQKNAVQAPHRPLLIVAGAGTGKTKTLTSRIIHLIACGVPAGDICALTFTNKAAKEMKKRIGADVSDAFIGTFHSFGARFLRKEGFRLGRKPNFVIFDDNDTRDLLKKILKRNGQSKSEDGPSLFLKRIGDIKNGLADIRDLKESPKERDRFLAELFEDYEKGLRENNAFDFDDLISGTVEILKKDPAVRKKYEKRYPYLLVDEYQDLNDKQYELVKLLAENSRKLSVVGDDQQTIYSWRGSNLDIFLNFEKDWPDSTVIILDQNYRSSGVIIRAASAMISNNARQKPKSLWTANPPGSLIALTETESEDQEAQWIAEKIVALPDKDAAILYRTNAQSRALEQALIERDIAYEIFGGLKFYERREIKDLLAVLRLKANPADKVSSDRVEKILGKRRFAEFAPWIKNAPAEPQKLITGFVEKFAYAEYIKKNMTNLEDRSDNIRELVYFSSSFANLGEFLEQTALLQATDSVKKDGAAVKLMTVHLAKGLEFDNVFVAGCNEGLLPHARSMGSPAELEEERRLMYVAMTRAKKNLFLSFYDLPSRFLSEIPQEFLEFTSLRGNNLGLGDEERYITLD